MLNIALATLATAWVGAGVFTLSLCVSAARADRTLARRPRRRQRRPQRLRRPLVS